MVTAEQVTEQAIKDSVQKFSDTTFEQSSLLWYTTNYELLPQWGLRSRDRALRQFYRAIHGGLFQGAVSGFVKKVKATPWEIKGPPRKTKYFQTLLQNANFGAGWGTFVSKVLTDYLTQDFGSVVEIIGRGDPMEALPDWDAITGISTIDSLSCGATDNPTYPLVYQSRKMPQGIHVLHSDRAKRLIDMPDPDELALDTGLCAMSRAVSPANVQILMGRYQNEKLNDMPPSGIMTVSGLNDLQIDRAMNKYEHDRRAAGQSVFRNVMRLPGLDPDKPPQITFTQFSQLPDNFDYRQYMETAVDMFAAALNIDRQEFWTLASKTMGSGTQSEILHSKSERKGFADAYSMLERLINLFLPPDLEFAFKFQDRESDKQDAERAQLWVTIAYSATDLTREQRLLLMANNVEQLADVILDDKGQIKLPDDDVRPDEQSQVIGESNTTIGTPTGTDAVAANDTTPIQKAANKEGYVYLSFADNADLVKLQQQMKEKFPTLELTKPEELHITLAYADYIDDAAFGEAMETRPAADDLSVYSGVIDTFEPEYESNTPLILRVTPTPSLLSFQRGIRKAIEEQGAKVSTYSKSWIPHITLGYSAKPIEVDGIELEFKPELDPIELCWARDDYEVIHREPTIIIKRKDFSGTADDFGRDFYDLITAGISDEVSRRRFGTVARAQLRNYGTKAYKDGMEFNGVVDDLSDSDLSTITDWLAETSEYVTNFANSVYDGGVSEAQIRTHVDMWANKSLRDIYNKGILAADADAMMQWHYDPGKEHCDDCKKLHGQIHRMSAWVSRDLVPGSSNLKCKGYRCGCTLRRTNKRASGSFLTRSIFTPSKGLRTAA